MLTRFTPIENPILDPRNEVEIVDRALDRVFVASNGRINDFSQSAPVRALIEGQAFAAAELLYYLNQLPEAVAIAFLQLAGIQRRLGSAAQVMLIFTLSAPLGNPFVIPQGYEVRADSERRFRTDTLLIIPAGNTSGTVSATAIEVGSAGNVGAYTISQLSTPLAFLKAVTNTAAASGGTNAETLADTKARAFASLRRRGLVAKDDYEQETQALLGVGSVALCMGNLAADRITAQRGCVHLFCLNPDQSPLSSAQRHAVQAELQRKSHLAVFVYVSDLEVVAVDLYVIAALLPGSDPQAIATDLRAALAAYLQPGSLPPGETIILKELEYLVRQTGVSYVQSVTIGAHLQPRLSTNFALPHAYSAANLADLGIELIEGGTSYHFAFGLGDPD